MLLTDLRLLDRLRWAPVPATVKGSLPVLFFGDLAGARVATIGLNPSRQEYLSPDGDELEGSQRRFDTLGSLRAVDRTSMTGAQCSQAIQTMRAYFGPTKPVYSWFRPLTRVVEGLGASFVDGSAAHLDLVQEATDPTWSSLPRRERDDLLARDLEFLRWQIEAFELQLLVCTSATVLDQVLALVGATVRSDGEFARVRWKVAQGRVNGRAVGVVGWNIPLARPTGLDAGGHRQLGATLQERLDRNYDADPGRILHVSTPVVDRSRPVRPVRAAAVATSTPMHDNTKFTVRLGTQTFRHQTKRGTMLKVVRHLVQRGHSPESIAAAMVDRGPKTWFVVDGEHDDESFLKAAMRSERGYDDSRWFADPGQLCVVNGRTYALSNQWGSHTFPPTIENFKRTFADADFDVQPE